MSPRERMGLVRHLILYYEYHGWNWTTAAAFLPTRDGP